MSQMSREDMLRELELLPVWQLRQPLPTPFKRESAADDNSEKLVTEQLIHESAAKAKDIAAAEPPVIETELAESLESAMPEFSISEASIPEPAPSAPLALETPMYETPAPEQMEMVETILQTPAQQVVLEQALSLPLRLLLSEDSTYGFLIEPYAADADVQQIETLLKNMIRAMQASCRVDVTGIADNIFAEHTPKLIISLGAAPANYLSGKTYNIDEWRHIQQQDQPHYHQIPLIVTYHPVHLLANATDKALAWRDLCAAMKLAQRL